MRIPIFDKKAIKPSCLTCSISLSLVTWQKQKEDKKYGWNFPSKCQMDKLVVILHHSLTYIPLRFCCFLLSLAHYKRVCVSKNYLWIIDGNCECSHLFLFTHPYTLSYYKCVMRYKENLQKITNIRLMIYSAKLVFAFMTLLRELLFGIASVICT